jgi:hypothetical protein
MNTSELLQMHDAGLFNANLNLNLGNILYLDSICAKYNLTDYEKQLLQQHGFMVTDRQSFNSFGEAIKDIFIKDLPVFVSADAILHSVHKSYDLIFMQTEGEILIQNMKDILTTLHSQLPSLDAQYASNPRMIQSLKDLDIYFGVAKKLLGINTTMYYSSNNGRVDTLMGLIDSLRAVQDYSMFGEKPHEIDFSQFKPRGHYASPENIQNYPDLPNYFRTMIWLGRTEIYLLPYSYKVTSHDYSVMESVILSALVHKAAKNTSAYNALQNYDNIIKLFVGETDNVSLFNLDELLTTAGITDPAQLTDTLYLKAFQDSLLTRPYVYQKINSQIIMANETMPDSIIPASSFMLMGQRFIIDSYITAQVVYDRIKWNNQYIRRMLPSTLDILFGLGNDASAQLLKPELDQYHYSSNLATLRYLVDGYDSTFWNSSLFNIWLNSIRQLNPPAVRTNLPSFMSTAAYWQEKMNTQLGSWTELRHDNLLYAKESYSVVPSCSFPYSYVEPFPEFYKTMKSFGVKLKAIIQPLTFSTSNYKDNIISYCSNLTGICDTLAGIAQKELDNTPLTNPETLFLSSMLSYNGYPCGEIIGGWYYKLYYQPVEQFQKKNYIVADIHTSAYDEMGSEVGWVKHVGTGKINLGVFVVKYPADVSVAYVGPLYSYYDYTTNNFLRLTDEEWTDTYQSLSLRPDWVNLYLANEQGLTRGQGSSLLTGLIRENNPVAPKDFLMLQNYPNPFNPYTVIRFFVPAEMSNTNVEFTIYDIQGKIVKRLVNDKLSTGNYVMKWEGVNDNNLKVSSGVYFCRGKIGEKAITIKMVMLK